MGTIGPAKTPLLADAVDVAAWASLAAAIVVPTVWGGGASATGRATFQILAGVSFVMTASAMAIQGAWRWSPSRLWIVPVLLLAIAVGQCVPLPESAARWTAGGLPRPIGAASAISARPTATFDWLRWAVAAAMVMFVAASQTRSIWRLRALILALVGSLGASAALGAVQLTIGNGEAFGLINVQSPATPFFLRDAFSVRSAIGPLGFQHWIELAGPGGLAPGEAGWYAPQSTQATFFGGFLTPAPWIALAVLVAPSLLAAGAGARSLDDRRGWFWWGAGAGLLWTAAWFASLIATVGVALIAGATVIGLTPAPDRRRAGAIVGAIFATATFLGVLQTTRAGGVADHWRLAMEDNAALAEALRRFGACGCGMGAMGDVWPLVRSTTAQTPVRASSLLATIVEGGVGFALVLALGAFLLVRQWRRASPNLSSEESIALGGVIAGLGAVAWVGVVGPGLESPATLTAVAAAFGIAIRGLATGWRETTPVLGGAEA